MFRLDMLKQNYVGIVHIYDLKSKKTLLQGGGHFDVQKRKLDVLFDCDEVYKNVEWVPILQTEQGYFCPAQSQKGHLVGSGVFTYDHRKKFGMSSFFHWKAEKGIDYITKSFDTATIEVAGQSGNSPLTTFSDKWQTAERTTKAEYRDIEEYKVDDLTIKVRATYMSGRRSVEQRLCFIASSTRKMFARTDWSPLANAFRLYWLFQHDRTTCNTLTFCLGDNLNLVTDIMQLSAYDDNTDIVANALRVESPMNVQLLADTVNFFMNQTKTKGRGGIEFGFYRLLGYRFGTGTKRIGDDLLDLVFALDGFCADTNKSAQRKLTKPEKEEVRVSIQKVLENIEAIKDTLDTRVYDFYNKPMDMIYESITRKPYRESVQQCFETLGMDYAEHEDVIIAVDKIRQLFVHGKGYETDDLANKIYTHGTTTINEAADSGEMQIIFGQSTGLSDKYYKMVRQLFMHYFVKPDQTTQA